jgi:FkbM family methyltransferase
MKTLKKIINATIRNLVWLYSNFEILHKIYVSSFRKKLSLINRIKLELKPRYETGVTNFWGRNFEYADSSSFLFIFNEIFEKEIYRFKSDKKSPVIIDCGSNIGLSVLYFKILFPESEITAFEPNPKIFQILSNNVKTYGLNQVALIEKAVWIFDGEIEFYLDNADGSRISTYIGKESTRVGCVSLKTYLNQQVDFLKIDIEGAETSVLKDCCDLIKNIRFLFIEFHSFVNRQQELDQILFILSSSNFRYYISHIGVFSEYPFVSRKIDSEMDNQLNIYCINNQL